MMSLTKNRLKVLQLTKSETEDARSYLNRVDKAFEEAKMSELSDDQFKWFMFVAGLRSEADAELRNMLEKTLLDQKEINLAQMGVLCDAFMQRKKNEMGAPWHMVHLQVTKVNGSEYAVFMDAYSNWPEVTKIDNFGAVNIVSDLEQIVDRFGLPDVLITYDDALFEHTVFRSYCLANGVQHRIESEDGTAMGLKLMTDFVNRFENTILDKLKEEDGDCSAEGEEDGDCSAEEEEDGDGDGQLIERAVADLLRTYRSTPLARPHGNQSPAELMFGRQMRTTSVDTEMETPLDKSVN